MKKMISTQGLTFGEFCDENMTRAIKERISPRLKRIYSQFSNEEIHTSVSITYNIIGGEVQSIVINYTIDAPTPERLSNFRDVCDIFFNLHSFTVDYEQSHVFFMASDMYDMGCLIHALDVMGVSLESVVCAVDEKKLDDGEVYTPSGDTIVQVPNVPRYRIREHTSWMAPTALQKCPRLRFLDIPYGMFNHEEVLKSFPKIKYKEWETFYDGTIPDEEIDEDEDDEFTFDEHHVAYSKDGKTLLFIRQEFQEDRYEVPDGVEEIADMAFCWCPTFVELSLPRSIRHIGDNIFGTNGGHIEIRDTLK